MKKGEIKRLNDMIKSDNKDALDYLETLKGVYEVAAGAYLEGGYDDDIRALVDHLGITDEEKKMFISGALIGFFEGLLMS